MGIQRPYHRTCRQFVDGRYELSGHAQYIENPGYSSSPEQYVRAYLILQKDLLDLFDYIEPSDTNLVCYSYRIFELLLRACTEIEANCKAILLENGYSKNSERWDIKTYAKIEKSHRLSSYEISLPNWFGVRNHRTPFSAWKSGGQLKWYRAYNDVKHDRHNNFSDANLDNTLDAICGLLVLLSAQFFSNDFSPSPGVLLCESANDPSIGNYFTVHYPHDWPEDLRYDFNWPGLPEAERIFDNYPYN